MLRPLTLAALAGLALSCATAKTASTASGSASSADPATNSSALSTQTVATDTPKSTPGGATFTAPAGWSLAARESSVVLAPPEADTHVALVDVPAADADAAVAAAWKIYKPEMSRKLLLGLDRAARNGWDSRRVYTYETSPNERAVVQAIALKKGAAWTVVIIDGSEMTLEKRGGPMSVLIGSLRPKGYARESFAGRKAHPLDAGRIATLREFLEKGMAEAGVPGVGLALIDGGKIVFEGGLGVKQVGKPDKVDANTLFIAASNTKALTTLLLARLVDAGKLRWDQPVVEAFPSFKLGDAETTKRVLVKHLICACTGLPRQDLEWLFEFDKSTPAAALASLATMQPTSKFGEVFQYSNPLAAAAGFIGGSLAHPGQELGAAYDAAMDEQVFKPLGMASTTFDFKKALNGNVALPYGLDIDGKVQPARMDMNLAIVPVRPAGGVWTSAHDLAQYVLLELAAGKLPDGTQWVSSQNLMMRRAPQVAVGEDLNYGMGLMVDTSRGIPIVHHGGDLLGYHSDMIWLPEQQVGAVILTNGDEGHRLRGPLLRRLQELIFDGKEEAQGDLDASIKVMRAGLAKERERLTLPADPAEAGKLAARYHNDALGNVDVRREAGKVILDAGEWHSEAASRKNEDGSISFITTEVSAQGIELVVAPVKDGKRGLIARDGQHEYRFDEVK